jgi:dynactin-5
MRQCHSTDAFSCVCELALSCSDARNAFATTKRQNKVSKESVLCGSDNIGVKGKTIIESQAVIRGDLSTIELGSYCVIARAAVIRPAEQKFQGRIAYIPMTIGDHVIIEENSIIEAAAIGDCTHIGKNCQVVS